MSDVKSERVETTATAQEAMKSQLRLLDVLRGEIERGKVVCLFTLLVRSDRTFDVTSAGDISMATLAGMLGKAQLDALQAI